MIRRLIFILWIRQHEGRERRGIKRMGERRGEGRGRGELIGFGTGRYSRSSIDNNSYNDGGGRGFNFNLFDNRGRGRQRMREIENQLYHYDNLSKEHEIIDMDDLESKYY